MNKSLIYIALTLLAALNIVLLFRSNPAPDQTAINELSSHKSLLKLSKSYYNNYVINAQFNNDILLDANLALINNEGTKVSLKNLYSSGVRMIIRSTENGCTMCIENELKIIKRYAKLIGGEHIALVTTHDNLRKLEVFKQVNNIPFKMYMCPKIGMPFERSDLGNEKTFVFVIDSDLKTHNFFLPEVSLPEISENYYAAVFTKNVLVKSEIISSN